MFKALTAVSAMMVAQTMSLIMSRLSTAQPAKPGYFESPAVNNLDSASMLSASRGNNGELCPPPHMGALKKAPANRTGQ